MSRPASKSKKSVTDSPWYWVYLFATAGLIALILIGPKFASRQAQIEGNSQARQRAAQQVAGRQPDVPPASSRNGTTITLWPLFVLLGILVAVAGARLLLGRRQAAVKDQAA